LHTIHNKYGLAQPIRTEYFCKKIISLFISIKELKLIKSQSLGDITIRHRVPYKGQSPMDRAVQRKIHVDNKKATYIYK
jgi:hypothetical protein